MIFFIFDTSNVKYMTFDIFDKNALKNSKTKRNNNNKKKVSALIQPVL